MSIHHAIDGRLVDGLWELYMRQVGVSQQHWPLPAAVIAILLPDKTMVPVAVMAKRMPEEPEPTAAVDWTVLAAEPVVTLRGTADTKRRSPLVWYMGKVRSVHGVDHTIGWTCYRLGLKGESAVAC